MRSIRRIVQEAGAFGLDVLEPRQMLSTSLRFEGIDSGVLPRTATDAPPSIVFGDVTGDGVTDQVYSSGSVAGGVGQQLWLRAGQGGGRFGDARPAGVLRLDAGELRLIDFTGDGRLDLVSVGSAQGGFRSWVRLMRQETDRLGLTVFNSIATRQVDGAVASVVVGRIGSTEPSPNPNTLIAITTRAPVLAAVSPRERLFTLLYSNGRTGVPQLLEDTRGVSVPAIGDGDGDGVNELVYASQTRGVSESVIKVVSLGSNGTWTTMAPRVLMGEVQSVAIDALTASPALGARVYVTRTAFGFDGSFRRVFTGEVIRMPLFSVTTPATDMEVVYTREFSAPSGSLQTRLDPPSVRIVSLTDLNGNGNVDVAVQVVDSISLRGVRYDRTSELVLLVDELPAPMPGSGPAFRPIVHQRLQQALPAIDESLLTGPAVGDVFIFAPLGGVGGVGGSAPSLITVDRGDGSGFARVRVHLNTAAVKPGRVAALASGRVGPPPSVVLPAGSFARGTQWSLRAEVVFPELMRYDAIDRVNAYRDSNNNGRLDASDELIGAMTQDPSLGGPDLRTVWTSNFELRAQWVGSTRFFVQVVSGNGVVGPARATERITIV